MTAGLAKVLDDLAGCDLQAAEEDLIENAKNRSGGPTEAQVRALRKMWLAYFPGRFPPWTEPAPLNRAAENPEKQQQLPPDEYRAAIRNLREQIKR